MKNLRDQKTHSEEYFGDSRDGWWNRDFIELMAKRWDLNKRNNLLEVGCGIGHWIEVIAPHLGTEHAVKNITGIDKEKKWIEKIAKKFTNNKTAHYKFFQGDAYKLPFKNDSFDIVTCQTLLIHLSDPARAVKEMTRVCKKNGIIICVEPENIFNMFHLSSLTHMLPVSEVAEIFEIWLRYERGKMNLGEGNNSMGGVVPGIFASHKLKNIKVYNSDKTYPIFPPYYKNKEFQTLIKQENEWHKKATGPWDKEKVRTYYKASGGDMKDFSRNWKLLEKNFQKYCQAIKENNLTAGGGGVFYLISGIK